MEYLIPGCTALDNNTDNIWGEPATCRVIGSTFSHPPSEGGRIILEILQMRTLRLRKVPNFKKLRNGSTGLRTQICPESLLSAPGAPLRLSCLHLKNKDPVSPFAGLPAWITQEGSGRRELSDESCFLFLVKIIAWETRLIRQALRGTPSDKA